MINPIARWPLISFFVLTYLLTWWIFPLGVPGFPVFPFGPDAAVLIVVALTAGRTGVTRVLASLLRWRAAPRWYALALLLPLLITLPAVFSMPALGAPTSALPSLTDAVLYLAVLPLAILIGGPLGEELGFRGYALPILLQRHRPLVAVAILGAAHALWHLPLFFTADPPPPAAFVLGLLSGGVVLAWLLNCTGNIVLVMILHGGANTAQQQFMAGFTDTDSTHVQWLTAIGWALTAALIIWRTRGTLTPPGGPAFAVPVHQVPTSSQRRSAVASQPAM